jgi:hypothetical protein
VKRPGFPALTIEQADEIRRRRRRHAGKKLKPSHKNSLVSMAAEFGVNLSVISRIARTESYGRKKGKCAPRSGCERPGADL